MSEQTQLNENQESKGLGDTIAKITNAVGLFTHSNHLSISFTLM